MNTRIRQLAAYVFWGAATTVVNIGVYALCRLPGIPVTVSTVIAWVASVAFAFVTNRRFVFASASSGVGIARECALFFGSRVFSGLMDVSLMFVSVNLASLPELPCKILSNAIVIVLNYFLSLFLVFRRKGGSSPEVPDEKSC